VRAADEHASGRGDKRRVEVFGFQRHVGAIRAVEEQGEVFLVADAENGQGGQALGIGGDRAHIDTLALELLADESPEVVGAHARDQRRAKAQPGGSDSGVGRTAADIFGERAHVLQPAADLLSIEVDAGAAERDQIEIGRIAIGAHREISVEAGLPANSNIPGPCDRNADCLDVRRRTRSRINFVPQEIAVTS
jgi:hypothetical protein